MSFKTALFIIATALAPTVTWAAYSADLYVSITGNDSSSGTAIAPLRTIQRASSLAKPGTVVHVAPGTYIGNIRTVTSGTASERIRYVSDKKWAAKIIGTGTEYHWDNRGSYVEINGFDISGPGRGGILNLGSHTLIMNNHVHDLKVSGGCTGAGGAGIVNANYQATDGDIIGNVVHDVGVPGSCNGVHGIYHSILRGRIANNISYRNSSFGIHLWHAANQSVIVNNTVFNNGSSRMGGGIVLGRGDTGVGVMTNTHVVNNIVFNNPSTGITQYCYSGYACIGSGNTVANNLVFGSRTAITMKVGSPTGTIAADPQFVNYQADGSGDYHLKSTSPAIDKGASALAPTTDLDGKPRQGAYDIGAYEYVSVLPAPSPAPTPAPTPTPTPTPSPAPSSPQVSLSSLKVAPGETIIVSISGVPKGVSAWAALYLASNPDSAWSYQGNWMWMNGTKTALTSPLTSATLKFIAPKEVGVYNIRLFANAGYANRISISSNFAVAAVAPAPKPTPTPTPAPTPTPSPSPSPSPAPAPTPQALYHLYVSPDGKDTNAGTQSAPLKTIVRASALAKPGTRIHVAPGTYAGGFKTGASGTAAAPIYYVSDVKWGAKIVGSGTGHIWHNYGNYVTVDGFELTGTSKTHGLISGPNSGGDAGHHFTATNNYVHDMAIGICGSGGAITGFSQTGHSRITNNIIRNISPTLIGKCATQQGIYISDTDSYIANNLISGVAAVGIHQWHAATRSTIVNNTVFNCLWGILLGGGDSGVLPNGSQDNYVANNIVANNANAGYMEYGKTSRNTYRNNLSYNNPKDVMSASGNSVSGMIKANPMFVNYQANGSGNYRLQSSSPAINKGLAYQAPANDLDGKARPLGGAIDLGAYESF